MSQLISHMKAAVRKSAHRLFVLAQPFGFNILLRHFYSEIPDLRELKHTQDWRNPRSMYGIRGADLEHQLDFVKDCVSGEMLDILTKKDVHLKACERNGMLGFGQIESEFLFCFIARHRPRRIIQIGAGISTAVIIDASRTVDYRPEITCIDPYPSEYLKELAKRDNITLIAKGCQHVELARFTDLDAGDLLFVDSTHTVKPGSEVNYLVQEILPRLKQGCYVHFHDIYFPYDYQCDLFSTVFFWSESSLLYAFLVNNERYMIAASLSMLHHSRQLELRAVFPNYRPAKMDDGIRTTSDMTEHFPSSIYLRTINAS